jgi:DNA-binding response OmpR family regulator
VIAIACSGREERTALASLCEHRGWNPIECESILAVTRLLRRVIPKVLILRYQLRDGYCDDIIRTLIERKYTPSIKIVVLLPPGASASLEARQVMLGADCVQRDPIRSDVLLAYLDKYLRGSSMALVTRTATLVRFSDAILDPLTRTLELNRRTVVLTPKEVLLIELLAGAEQRVVSYESLYSEILGRAFHGDTSNMRVLLAKLTMSARKVGLTLRRSVQVIPKTGYRYCGASSGADCKT